MASQRPWKPSLWLRRISTLKAKAMLKRSLGSASSFHVHPDFGGLRLLLRRLSSSQLALVCFHVQELKRLLTSRPCIICDGGAAL